MPRIQVKAEYLTSLTRAEQVAKLNQEVRCRLATSKIHGVGVFALYDIREGERCYCTPNVTPYFYTLSFTAIKELKPEIRELILDRWASIVNGSIFQSPNDDAGLLFFMNHDNRPNYDVLSDTALRDIKAGEEVLEDYRVMENWEQVYPWIKDL